MAMAITLIAALWESTGFRGTKRTLIGAPGRQPSDLDLGSASDLDLISFNDKTSSIGIHPGTNFIFGTTTDTVSFFEDATWSGNELVLRTGIYPDVTNFGVSISSVRFNGPDTRQSGLYKGGNLEFQIEPTGPAARIAPIPIVVRLYQNPIESFDWTHQTPVPNEENAHHLTLVQPSMNLGRDFGTEWNNAAALGVTPGPNFRIGDLARLYDHEQPDNAQPDRNNEIGGWHDFPPGYYIDLGWVNFKGTKAVGYLPGCTPEAGFEAIFAAARSILEGVRGQA